MTRGAARRLLVVAALALLGACNMVMTKDPLFAKADEAGSPRLKPGIWRQDPGAAPCQVDEAQPLDNWPACANGFAVRGGEMGNYSLVAGKRVWNATSFVLAAGDPRMFQIHLTASMYGTQLPPLYLYTAVEPTKFDEEGRIVALTSWPVLCGPPPPAGAKAPDGQNQRNGSLEPLPGLTMDASANDCVTTSPDAVRNAAKLSRQWTTADSTTRDHWVRDGER